MRFVCVSDTHGNHRKDMPDGDVLLHTGDFSRRSIMAEVDELGEWLKLLCDQKGYARAIVIAGNHDVQFERTPEVARRTLLSYDERIVYLQDESYEFNGVKFWGSPWQPEFFNWAFNLPRGKALAEKWALIPEDTDVLLTHGPPHGILDQCPHFKWRHAMEHVGCRELTERVEKVKPAFHQFGHIHESAGVYEQDGTLFLNACTMDGSYIPRHAPHVVDLVDGVASYVLNP